MVRTLGLPISKKENEKRKAVVIEDLKKIKHLDHVYLECGYGNDYFISDSELEELGVNVVSREEVLKQDIICDPKFGDETYVSQLKENQIVFGWMHAVQNFELTESLLKGKLVAYAWEDMYTDGRHVFWRNNEIAGEAAINHAFLYYGKFPKETRVAILGTGNTARGAYKSLSALGAEVVMYNSKSEHLFKKEMYEYDVIVNAILWDLEREDHIIYKEDLKKLKKGAMIIDISCDEKKGVETSIPTTINDPVYMVDDVLHYVVDHTPAMYFKTVSKEISKEVVPYINILMDSTETESKELENALIIRAGIVLDEKIKKFQSIGEK